VSDEKKPPFPNLGPPGMARRFATVPPQIEKKNGTRLAAAREAVSKPSAKPRARSHKAKRKGKAMKDKDERPPRRRGRPRSVSDSKPWEKLGICRAKYYRDLAKKKRLPPEIS